MSQQIDFKDNTQNLFQCIPHSLYLTNSLLSTFQITCPICYTIFQKPRKLPCGHVYCTQCIQDWALNYQKTCPLCRKQIKKTRGYYGRCDSKLTRIVQKLKVKCRNCCWEGSNSEFKQKFKVGAYIDQAIQQEIKEQKDEQIDQKTIILAISVSQDKKDCQDQPIQQKIAIQQQVQNVYVQEDPAIDQIIVSVNYI